MAKVNRLALVGTGGTVYEDGAIIGYIEEINVKITGNFEDIECCGTFEDDYAFVSYKCEGNMTYVKTGSNRDNNTMSDYKNGIMREKTIVTKLTNQNTGETVSYSIPNVVYTEVTPVDIKRGVIKSSVPFKCGMPIPLSNIADR